MIPFDTPLFSKEAIQLPVSCCCFQGRIFDLLLSAEVRFGNRPIHGFAAGDWQVEMQEDFVSQQEALFNKPSTDAFRQMEGNKVKM